MPLTSTLLETLQRDYPDITFAPGEQFEWQPNARTILYETEDTYFNAHLLHELGHALLNHDSYDRDIDLIAMERNAWQKAKVELGAKYSIRVDSDILHHDMDTYRDWLHYRSTCPHCDSNGIQIKKHEYKCVTCLKTWEVNEARTCRLRRIKK